MSDARHGPGVRPRAASIRPPGSMPMFLAKFLPAPLRMWLLIWLTLSPLAGLPVRAATQWPDQAPAWGPRIFLSGATVARAKGLALDAALSKRWHVADSGRDHVVFETPLDEPAAIGPLGLEPPDQTLLRIRTDFEQTVTGVQVSLQAVEIWYAGSYDEWSADVTRPYHRNLSNALASLQRQWQELDGSAAAGSAPWPPMPSGLKPSLHPSAHPGPDDAEAFDAPVGIWAYHAERHAAAQGCRVDDRGAVLLSGDADSELHRVHCARGALMVRCNRLECTIAR
ncbi:hypothetical protein F2Q65_11135 [Thiohalocapsa marina]|uniref:Uncharacterized protein n=1 Tax=Thiohalocapsa marina TaxID=424902 RepID=A0A5M8FJJ2_9GAMM|nr:hypothetical protein [Thiohalocapsa marina]KAA6184857.1 hypothetical protein F2Q65_11135 [Thiohalocapsa marina]